MPQVVGLVDTALAEAAQSGDSQALDAVVAECLPLVYSIVRRSLRSSADVDDVVQDVMVNVIRSLGSLRDPERLRAWLAAVTVNQIRAYLRSGRAESYAAADRFEPLDQPDPGSEFVGHTLLRLDLSEQRRETARATRWLDPEHRDLLGLWWLEASGHMSRAELIDALRLDPHHVTVRIGRMKEQLDGCRQVLRALEAGCPDLREVAADWDGETSSIWRKRFLRHIRECRSCLAAADGLIPPERLLAGLPLLLPPLGYLGPGGTALGTGGYSTGLAHAIGSGANGASAGYDVGVTHVGGSGGLGSTHAGGVNMYAGSGDAGFGADGTTARPEPSRHGARHKAGSHGTGKGGTGGTSSNTGIASVFGKPIGLAAVVLSVLGVAAAVILVMRPAPSTSTAQSSSTGQAGGVASSVASVGSVVVPSTLASKTSPSTTPSPTHAASHSASPSAEATHAAAPATTSSSASSGSETPAQQVLAVINQARESAGLAPYTMSADLIKSATAHNNLMANGCGLSHQCSGEPAIGDRVTAAGVKWTACGENIGEGGPEPDTQAGMAKMAVSLTNSMLAEKPPNDGHRLNILSSSFTEVGIAVTIDSSGTVWLTQDFAN
ncbi:sigma-70 family RNA polymerase sigma factor [Actinospica durhamensis]|uniref:RNA polymerase sigma factor n=1 Tax=Actinospica durhamensis TaxID=1508375 RepID=A0A941EQD5_9ACTN|nr:sigma-70 family RNA polymerase sigma factor [Actinospica durhamensis]MBR7835450.1 sigma-70 family RNA polymerase sigma factor [Actinospica durhamensis]